MYICRAKMLAPLLIGLFLPPPSFCEEANTAGAGLTEAVDESLQGLLERIEIKGLIEFGGGYKSTRRQEGSRESQSGIHLTTAEFGIAVAINDWIHAETVFLYEDPFDAKESDIALNTCFVTLGNMDKLPLYVSVGKMYVPFGALLTHLPDHPAADQPMTLLLGETLEKTVLAGMERSGFSLSGYFFDGDLKKSGKTTGMSFGFDTHYQSPEDSPMELLLGASYISNLADSDELADIISGNVEAPTDCVGGFDAYLHLGFRGLFFDAEYMTALEKFRPEELPLANGKGARPTVWNIEAGYNWEKNRNLEIVFKYAGSNETEALGLARKRFGIGLNQEIARNITASFAFLRDRYHAGDINGRIKGYTALGQIAVGF